MFQSGPGEPRRRSKRHRLAGVGTLAHNLLTALPKSQWAYAPRMAVTESRSSFRVESRFECTEESSTIAFNFRVAKTLTEIPFLDLQREAGAGELTRERWIYPWMQLLVPNIRIGVDTIGEKFNHPKNTRP